MGRRRAVALVFAGGILLAAALGWILTGNPGATLISGGVVRTIAPGTTNDFIVASSLSSARQTEAKTLFEESQRLADNRARTAASYERWNDYLHWASFVLSSIIVAIAGYFGLSPGDPTATQLIAVSKEAKHPAEGDKATLEETATPRADVKPHARRGKESTRPGRFISSIGLIAALAAIANGAAEKLHASAVDNTTKAKVLSEALLKTSKVTAQPTSEIDVDTALEELRRINRELQT